MDKILVTTDLSENSVAGIRFAIQLSAQRKAELVFLLVDELWDDTVYHAPAHAARLEEEKAKIQQELESLVSRTYQEAGVKPGPYQCVVYYYFGVINSIITYATRNDCSYICISTHGAGNLRKLLGTHTGELIKSAEVPLFCIPIKYTIEPITRILYASDMSNFEKELQSVVGFAKSAGADVDMINFYKTNEPEKTAAEIRETLKQKSNIDLDVYVEKMKDGTTLTENLDVAVEKYKPSLLVMFTNLERDFFEMLFLPSLSERYSFRTQVPMLVYNKTPETS